MIVLILIFLVMAGLLSFGWQWPSLIPWESDRGLELALRTSWLVCIYLPAVLLSDLVLHRMAYVWMGFAWVLFGLVTLSDLAAFRATELIGQAALLGLWIEAAYRAETKYERLVAWGAAGVHGLMASVGAVAKAVDQGWSPDSPEVLVRVLGPVGAAGVYLIPFAAIMAIVWMMGRRE